MAENGKSLSVSEQKALVDVDSIFNVEAMGSDLVDNVVGGFGVLSIRGSRFHVRFGGEEIDIVNEDGDARSSLEVVLLKANQHLQKTYYEGQYVPGNTDAPTCFSNDGRVPDESVEEPQAPSCASCPLNQWGSRMTDDGRKAKACQDSRRVAVVPANDIENTVYDGSLLLRVPAASLKPLKDYGLKLAQAGIPYNAVVTKLSFDTKLSFPKLLFTPVRPLSDEEKLQVAKVWGTVDNVLEGNEPVTVAPAATDVFDEPVAPPAPVAEEPDEAPDELPVKAAKAPKATKKKKVAKKATAAEPAQAEQSDETSDALDKLMKEFNL